MAVGPGWQIWARLTDTNPNPYQNPYSKLNPYPKLNPNPNPNTNTDPYPNPNESRMTVGNLSRSDDSDKDCS